ncbi:NAD(P)-dependent oxidoreductase [Micromonospora wenchangensis]|uniref:hypothetical protein n=1 Tax=Micromonospora wenchangensis TaxID=1185415 RepID=UPI00380F861B
MFDGIDDIDWVRLGHAYGSAGVVQPEDGGRISAADCALGFVDLVEQGDHHRTQVNLGHGSAVQRVIDALAASSCG